MGTQGLVTITKNGETVMKTVAGCNGFNAQKLADIIQKMDLETLEEVYEASKEVEFGCENCLVVFSKSNQISPEELNERYWETFSDPGFNPRWDSGIVEYAILIEEAEG